MGNRRGHEGGTPMPGGHAAGENPHQRPCSTSGTGGFRKPGAVGGSIGSEIQREEMALPPKPRGGAYLFTLPGTRKPDGGHRGGGSGDGERGCASGAWDPHSPSARP